MKPQNIILSIRWLLFGATLVPLIVTPGLLFPFVSGKSFFFRFLVELSTIFAVALFWYKVFPYEKLRAIIKNPTTIFVVLFFISYTLSAFFSLDAYSAFWGNIERMEGVLGMAHFLMFFFLITLFFERQQWLTFFKLFLITSVPVFWVALLQYAGVSFSSLIPAGTRPESLLGNPAFVGVHFLFVLATSLFLCDEYRNKKGFWYWFALCGVTMSLLGILLSQTRGVMLGLLAGIAIFFVLKFLKGEARVRWSYVMIVIVGVLSVFMFTRHLVFWQYIPGVGRLLTTSTSDTTIQTRLIATKISWSAFKERPLLGWGPENYGIAFNSHYDPTYLSYEEAWFDRAHNKVAEIAVMTGVVGLLSYLGIFFALFFVLYRRWTETGFRYFIAFFIAYFLQNLALFDQVNSYVVFFSSLGFVVSTTFDQPPLKMSSFKIHDTSFFTKICVTGIICFLFFVFYSYTLLPYLQVRRYVGVTKERAADVITQRSDSFLYPITFAQGDIRNIFANTFLTPNVLGSREFDFFSDKILHALEEWVKLHPRDPRLYIKLIEAYNERAKRDVSFSLRAEELGRKALVVAPKRQELYFQLAYTLVTQGRGEEAIDLAKRAVDLSPSVGKSHYVLGVILSLSGKQYWREGEEAIDRGLALKLTKTLEDDRRNILVISRRNIVQYIKERDRDGVMRNARRIVRVDPATQTDFENVIVLAERGDWISLDSIVK